MTALEAVERSLPGSRGSRAALAGVAFAALFSLGWALVHGNPKVEADDAQIAAFLESTGRLHASRLAALYVLPLAAIAFMWFAAAFRDRVVRGGGREHTMFATVYMMAATGFFIALFLMAAIELALVWGIESGSVDDSGVRATIALGTATSQLLALRAGAVYVAVSTARARRSGLFPRWFSAVSFVVAASLMLVASRWGFVLLLLPIWTVVASWFVLSERRNQAVPVEA